MIDLWKAALDHLEKTLQPQSFSTWIRPIRPLRLEDHTLVLEVPNRFFADWLQDHDFVPLIQKVLTDCSGQEIAVEFAVKRGDRAHIRENVVAVPPPGGPADWRERARKLALNPKYTFDSFVVGSCNQFAHAASLAVAEKSPRTYNPLFIYGGVGLGKTHLLNAIGNFKIATYPEIRVCYIHSETFMNELIQALANKKMPEFREKYRRMDILLMDDIQFIAGKERTQEEFFHTFNALYESHCNIVVTSDKFPKEIAGLEARLRSRFEWGLIADIQPPDMETKVAILQRKAETESIPLPYEVALFLASNFSSNIRELEGSLVRISAFASLTHSDITVELTKEVLKDFIRDSGKELTVERVLKEVSQIYGVSISDLRGKRRTKAVALPRQVAMYLSRELTECSFPEIGQKIGSRDHSTVMYACTKIANSLKTSGELRNRVESIRNSLSGSG
ncbi:MAG TPA: chromosomal replication initiator protein DnaA [Deferrisomatales bacterium]|nr:chromosomal replication initiator protein DnaA [Deferrisomatales bacterium]